MGAIAMARAQLGAELRSAARDPLACWLAPLALLVSLLVRLALPALLAQVGALVGADLAPYAQPIGRHVGLLVTPTLAGMVFGFLLLDMRDDRTLAVIQTTPLALRGFLGARMAWATLATWLITAAATLLIGQGPALAALAGAALLAAPLGALLALALAALAENKVQGMALTKLAGALLVAPLAAPAAPPALAGLLLALPSAWPGWAAQRIEAGDPLGWGAVVAGVGLQALAGAGLARRIERRASG